jgi:outer membrane protein TolC
MIFPFGPGPETTHYRRPHKPATPYLALLVVALPVLVGNNADARPDLPLTLAEAEDLALAAEPGRLAIEARAAALDERAVVAGSLPEPTLRVGVNNFPLESGGFSTEGMTQAMVAYRQAFPAGKTRALGAEKFGLLADEMSASAEARARNVRTAAQTAWLELYFLHRADALILESRPFFADLAEITRSLYAVGRKTQQDVLRAELELSRLDDRLIDIERQRARARAALAEWIGDEASRPVALNFPDWNSLPPLAALQQALAGHPALLAANAQIDASKTAAQIAAEQSKPTWALDIGYGYRQGILPNGEPRSDMVTVGVTVGLPFFRSRSVDSELTAALHERSAAQAGKLRMERELDSQLRAEYAQWQEFTRRLELYDTRILDQSQDHAEAALLAYRSDTGDFADVMRAYIDFLNTRIEHIRLSVDRARSYAMLANLGGLTP